MTAHVRDLFDLSGRLALVTGGSRGLGLEIAGGLAEAGARVAIVARRDAWLRSAEAELSRTGPPPLVLSCDVSKPDQVASTVGAVLAEFGGLDVLVNAAGVSWGAPAVEMPVERFRDVMEVNLTGTFLVSQAVGRHMIGAGRGTIINLASVVALVGSPPDVLDAVGYAASKGAVVSLTRDLAVKWAAHGVRVNAIAPGYFPTRMTDGVLARHRVNIEAQVPLGRIGRPGELKGAAVFLASAASDYVTGHVLVVDGGYSAR